MIRDLLFLRVFGGKDVGRKRITDITGDDVFFAYKRQMKFLVLAILGAVVFIFLVGTVTKTNSRPADLSKASEHMDIVQYMNLPEIRAESDKLFEQTNELYRMMGKEGQSKEYYDNIRARIDENEEARKDIKRRGGFKAD